MSRDLDGKCFKEEGDKLMLEKNKFIEELSKLQEELMKQPIDKITLESYKKSMKKQEAKLNEIIQNRNTYNNWKV